MSQRTSSRIWVIFGIGIAVIASLGLLLALLGRRPGEPAPMITLAIPTPSGDLVVASVNDHSIGYSFWMEAVLLDQVMSGLAGQPAPTPDETLQRLINEELVLQTVSPEQRPTAEQVEARIAALEQTWGVDDAAVVTALERSGLTRAAFERAVGRLLTVQVGLDTLQSQGYDTTTWLEKQRASAEIQILESVAALAIPTAQSPTSTPFRSPLSTPTAESPLPSPAPVPATETPFPTPVLAIPEVAPDFTLERAGGGVLTLTKQLAQGPVVLVFFQKCG
ncbi:MAG: hypothetical protein ACE5OS_12445 [Anaerolineae bacterium]